MDCMLQMILTILKKNNLFILIILFSNTLVSANQKTDCHPSKNLVGINLWSFIPTDNVTFYNIQYNRKITCKNVFGVDLKLPVNSNVDGFGIGVEYRHYFYENAFKGFYLNPSLSNINLKSKKTENNEIEEVDIYAFNLLIGYTLVFGKHFSLDLGGGITYNTGPSLQETTLKEGQSNTLPNFRFSIGWAF